MNTKFKKLNICISLLMFLALVVGLAVPAFGADANGGTTVLVDNLQPSWTAPGGGGVFSSYQGPADGYTYDSPGTTASIDGREAAPIYAGVTEDPTDLVYEDQGLFALQTW